MTCTYTVGDDQLTYMSSPYRSKWGILPVDDRSVDGPCVPTQTTEPLKIVRLVTVGAWCIQPVACTGWLGQGYKLQGTFQVTTCWGQLGWLAMYAHLSKAGGSWRWFNQSCMVNTLNIKLKEWLACRMVQLRLPCSYVCMLKHREYILNRKRQLDLPLWTH